MLPIFRAISVGGVLLAITITALALSPPGASHMQFTAVNALARGALIDRDRHPEWRQFLILAALRRADEIGRLRDLPDTPARLPEIPNVAPDYVPVESQGHALRGAPKYAGLPARRTYVVPGDETGSIGAAHDATIPIDIGERSSTELPVTQEEDKPPVITIPLTVTPDRSTPSTTKVSVTETPEQAKVAETPRKSRVQPRHRAKAPAPANTSANAPIQTTMPPPFNILQAIFESLLNSKPVAANTQPTKATVHKRRTTSARPRLIHSVSQ